MAIDRHGRLAHSAGGARIPAEVATVRAGPQKAPGMVRAAPEAGIQCMIAEKKDGIIKKNKS